MSTSRPSGAWHRSRGRKEGRALDYLFDNFHRVWPKVLEHLALSGASLAIAMLIAIPLGFALSRAPRLATPVLVALGIIYTIPAFALFAFIVPFTGIGAQPAIIALTAYALVVLVRNTLVAFTGVSGAVKEAAVGMGMSGVQMLRKIELPLALPVMVAGLRIAALSTVALASIAAWVGNLGLGQLLKEGINNEGKLYAGLVCITAIAVLTDLAFRLVERAVRRA